MQVEKAIVIGAGGHARSVLDILLENNEYEIMGCLDPVYKENKNIRCLENVTVIGTDDDLEYIRTQGCKYVFVAIGNPSVRKHLYEKAISMGYMPINAISRYARISKYAKIGWGTCLMAGAVINVNCMIGNGCIINTNSSLDHDCHIEDYVHVAPGVAISGTTKIGEGTHIGTNSAVVDGITIGEWSYIGAGAAVVGNIPAHKMAYGVPARIIRDY